jgi:hypothetical protein
LVFIIPDTVLDFKGLYCVVFPKSARVFRT